MHKWASKNESESSVRGQAQAEAELGCFSPSSEPESEWLLCSCFTPCLSGKQRAAPLLLLEDPHLSSLPLALLRALCKGESASSSQQKADKGLAGAGCQLLHLDLGC